MASVKIPAWPKGVAGNVWANKLADASVYAVESELLNFDTGTAVTIFAVPEDSVILGIGLERVTAFTVTGGESNIAVLDTAGSNLVKFGNRELSSVGYTLAPVLRRYSKVAGVPGTSSRAITVSTKGLTAGTFRIWLQFKPNRRTLRSDYA